jgi:MFS family permease
MEAGNGRIVGVLRTTFANRDLRRVELSFAGFNAAEFAVWIAMLVFAYDQGGATTAGLVALIQLAPAALFAPLAATLGDRHPPGRVLALGYLAQAAGMAATAVALAAAAPDVLVYGLAAIAATAVTVTRPTQSALLPALARTPDELTAANAVSGWIESLGMLVAPAGAGVLLTVGGAGLVFAVMAGAGLASAALIAGLRAAPAPWADNEGIGAVAGIRSGIRALAENPAPRAVVALLGAQFVVIGALDVLCVVLAVAILDFGGPAAGYLNAAFGAGGVLGIALTANLVGRARYSGPMLAGLAACSAALCGIAALPVPMAAFALLVVAGAGRSLFDVAGRTLLQRSAPPHVLSGVFGLLEAASMAGLAVGSLLAPALVAWLGGRGAFLGVAFVLPLVALAARRWLAVLDRSAEVPIVELGLLRSLPLFAPVAAPELEAIARRLEPRRFAGGEVVIRAGDRGERFFVVADGELDVSTAERTVATLDRGNCFGEIALLAERPRTATVIASTDGLLFTLEGNAFVAAVSGHSRCAAEADRLVAERLARSAPVTAARSEVLG